MKSLKPQRIQEIADAIYQWRLRHPGIEHNIAILAATAKDSKDERENPVLLEFLEENNISLEELLMYYDQEEAHRTGSN